MKVLTDPATGVTTCELHKQDRKIMADTKSILEQLAFHWRGGDGDDKHALAAADTIGRFLGYDPDGADFDVDPRAGPTQ